MAEPAREHQEVSDSQFRDHTTIHQGTVHGNVYYGSKPPDRADFLRRLRTSPYEDRKDRNPRRVSGTCEWFTAHPLFQIWLGQTSALLWVSADPGCGKSVLAKHLIDDIFPPSDSRTTCYFFFKDDFEDQKVLKSALCCLLHQLFTQKPALLRDETIEDYRDEGDQLLNSTRDLWRLFLETVNQHSGEVICILDALDECVDVAYLTTALSQLYDASPGTSRLKFLITSRPYRKIQQGFRHLQSTYPTIHLSGENQDEVDKIAQEITITIRKRVEELGVKHLLSPDQKQLIYEELSATNSRTYLWVHLVIAELEEAILLSRSDLEKTINALPRTVEQAYERILQKSHFPQQARKILLIIIGADRPLSVAEMSVILAFEIDKHKRCGDLVQDLLKPDRLQEAIREACGLFVTIENSQIFLLHQTAREFLVQLPTQTSDIRSSPTIWQHTLNLAESHQLLAEICIRYLLLAEFEDNFRTDRQQFTFYVYAACSWAAHYYQIQETSDATLRRLALQLCHPPWLRWLNTFGRKRFVRQQPKSSLSIASYFGLTDLVESILQNDRKSLTMISERGQRSALSWASERGHTSVVHELIKRVPAHQVTLRDWSSYPTIVNSPDAFGKTPLWYATSNGHQDIVRILLQKGAKVDIRDKHGLTPLLWAAHYGHSGIVALLLSNGAKQDTSSRHLETKDRDGCTALLRATKEGDEAVVQLLLATGKVNVNAKSHGGWTPLHFAIDNSHEAVIQQLLATGNVDVNAKSSNGWTPLHRAARSGLAEVVRQLLETGNVDVNAKDDSGHTPLHQAARGGHTEVVRQLLTTGYIYIHTKDHNGQTPLHVAALYGHKAVIQLLLATGEVDINARTNLSRTALHEAARSGQAEVVQELLRTANVNINAKDITGCTPLFFAEMARCQEAVQHLRTASNII